MPSSQHAVVWVMEETEGAGMDELGGGRGRGQDRLKGAGSHGAVAAATARVKPVSAQRQARHLDQATWRNRPWGAWKEELQLL